MNRFRNTIGYVVLAILLSGVNAANASSCSAWSTCDTALTSNTTVDAALAGQGYVSDGETEHFSFFLKTTSPAYPTYDATRLQIMKDQMECGYRYYMCEVGLLSPSASKIQVYIGDGGNVTPVTSNYLTLNDSSITPTGQDSTLYTTPVHELFHYINWHAYAYNGNQNVVEGLATLGEQVVSSDNLTYSYQRTGRLSMFSQTAYDLNGTYAKNVFWRYLMEQIKGAPASLAQLDEDWAVRDYLDDVLNEMAAVPGIDATQLADNVLQANLTPRSRVTDITTLLDNFNTMRYALPYVRPFFQPEYYFTQRNAVLANTSLAFTSTGNVINVGTQLRFENASVNYNPSTLPFNGYNSFLGAEYHLLAPDLSTVNALRFTDAAPDPDIRHQLIVRYDSGLILATQVLENRASQIVRLRRKHNIAELVFVAYTINDNPYVNGTGRVYDVTIEGR